ncbi:MAG: efflux RND transporter permease subunit [Fuerstiella sp.]
MSTLFLRNPRLTLLTVGLLIVAGLSSYIVLPRMEDPLLTERAAMIFTAFPGADAKQVETLVTEPLEDELREIAEIKKLTSSSRSSLSTIVIELRDDVYTDDAAAIWSRIRDRMADAEAEFPTNASKPRFERMEVTAYARLIGLVWDPPTSEATNSQNLASGQAGRAILRRTAETLREQLLAVNGTKLVDVFGEYEEEITVKIDPERAVAIGLNANQVSAAIQASDSRFTAGALRNSESDLLIEVSGELNSLERVQSIPIQTSPSGQVVTVADVADVRRGVKSPPSDLAIVDGKPAVVLACLIRADQRVDWWNIGSMNVTQEFQVNLPRGIRMVDVFNQNSYVTDRLQTLRNNMLIGAISVMAVIFVLMGWRSAVIVGAALPLSAFMVFTSMRFSGIPIHQMSVTGLIIAIGLLIDNAIVVVDEVSQKLQRGKTALEAVGKTVRHLAVPLFGSTFTTALAFAPIALMPGPAGEFVGAIAINVIVAIFSSLVLSMTVVPALTGFLGVDTSQKTDPKFQFHWYHNGIRTPRILAAYERLLKAVMQAPALGILIGVFFPIMGFVQARLLPEQFFPPADRDQVSIEFELTSQASIEESLRHTQDMRDYLLASDFGVDEVTWWLGRSGPPFYYNQLVNRRNQPQFAQALVSLNSSDDLAERINGMQRELDKCYPQARVLVRQLEQGPPFDAPIEVQVFGSDLEILTQLSEQLHQLLATIPEVTHVRAEVAEPQPRLTVRLDEEKARLLGLSHQDIAMQMAGALEGTTGGMILEGTEDLPVRVRIGSENRDSVDQIEALNVIPDMASSNANFRGIPLTALGSVELTPEQSAITRRDRRRMTLVQAHLEAGVLPAPVLAKFQKMLAASQFQLPVGYQLKYEGEAAQRDDAVGNLMASVGVLAMLMVAALVLSFRSFRMAGIVAVVAFLAVGLGLGALWAFGYAFGFMAIIGTMGLVGVAINDSIVVLAAIQGDEKASQGDPTAMRRVITDATRHVVATSLTTIAGFTPLLLGGGGFWPPLAVTIAGGVGGATILALIFVPAMYLLLMKPSAGRIEPSAYVTGSVANAASVTA